MVEPLHWVTLAYAAVLVLALAVSLTAIWIQLRRIGTVLGEARAALGDVELASQPLGEHLRELHAALTRGAGPGDR
jgi:hypothetical protein